MKRDMDLLRRMLIALEEDIIDDRARFTGKWFPDVDPQTFFYHARLLDEAGYVHCRTFNPGDNNPMEYYPTALTMSGHDFLDATRRDTVWNKLKSDLGSEFGKLPLELIKTAGVRFTALYLKQKLGFDIF